MLNYKPKLTIPIVTVDNDEYTTPTLNSDGRLVVSAKTVKQGANTLLNYDPLNNKYTPINPHTASLDANIKARTFENVLKQQAADKEKQERLFADGKDPKQINSWIDTLFTPNPFSSLAYLIKDYTIDPLFSKDLTFVQKTTALVNNAVINLGDSMDYVVGQSAVRGGIQGAIEGGLPKAWENIKSATVGGPEGRPNFEWDDVIDTGNGWVDAGVTLFLELITDPSNLISFGTKSAIKGIGKEAFSTAILKSADDAGIKLLKNQADELTNAAIKTYLYKSDDLVKALQKSKIGRYADSPEAVAKFFTAMADNSKAMSEAKTLNLLKSVRTGTDALQQNVMRMVGATSGLGLGYYTTKVVIKGVDTASYAVSKINHVLKNVDLNTLTLKNSGEVFEGIVTELNKLSDVVGLSERMSARMIRRATQSFQEAKFAELDKILRKGTKSAKLIQELDAWAIKEGFESVMDMLDKIKYIRSAIPETVLSLYDNLNTAITRKVAGSIKDVVVPIKDMLNSDLVYSGTSDEVATLTRGLRVLNDTPYIKTYITDDMFKEVFDAMEHSLILKAIPSVEDKLDRLDSLITAFSVDEITDVRGTYLAVKTAVYDLLDDPVLRRISDVDEFKIDRIILKDAMLKESASLDKAQIKNFVDDVSEYLFFWQQDVDSFALLFENKTLAPVTVLDNFYDVLDSVDTALDDLMHSLGDKTHMRTDKIISTLQNKNSKHIVLDSAKRAIEGSEGTLDDVIIQIRNTIDITLEKNELADEVYTSVHQLADLVEDMKLDDYFTREGGLWQILEDWDSHGLSLDNAKELYNRLDVLSSKQPDDAGGIKTTILNTQGMLTELINSAGDLDALASKEVKDKLAKAVESIIYRTKLSHVQTLDMLLTTPGIPQGFADINSRSGVGDLLDVLNDTADLEDGVDSINFLKGLAKSTEVGNEILSVISGSALPDEWKNALYDTIAGKVRMRISDISNPYAFSNDLLIRSKLFIDNNNSAHMAGLNALTNTGDTLEEATTLHKYLFGAVKTNNIGRVHASYWNSVTDVLAKDYHKTFNVTYSVGQTGHKTGDIYELAVVLPNGASYKFIDLPKLKMFRDSMSEQTARKLYGKSKRQVQEFLDANLAKYSGQADVHTFDTTEDFATKVYEFFQGVKDASRNARLSPRLIGYNTAYDSKNTNTLLHNFNSRNMLSTYISKYHNSHELFSGFESFDAAQYVRMRFEGAIEATDSIANEFDGVTKKMAQLLEYANAGTDGYKATLMPDFNNRSTKSLRDVRDTIDEALAIIGNNGEATNFNMLTETQYKALVTKFTEQELAGMRNQIAGLLENLGETLLNIRKSNADLGQDLIVMDSLAEFSGEHNIMQILNKFMVNQDGVSALAFKTFYNPTIYREWFEGLAENTDPYFIEHSYEIADKLSKQFARVKHPMLIYELGDAEVKHVRGYLASIFAQTNTAKFSAWGQYMLNVKEDTNKIQDYIISKVYYDNIIKTMDEETYVAFFEDLVAQTNDGVLAKYIRLAEETIFNNVAARIPGIPVNHSQAVKDSNKILTLLEETKSLDTLAEQLNNLEDTLVLQADLRDTYGVNLPTTRIREQLTTNAREFVDEINNTLSAYDSTFKAQMENTKSSHIRGQIKEEYTERVSEVLSHLENIAHTDSYNRVSTILDLDAEEYVKFLYKNAQGVQIIDLGADIFKSSDSTMEQLLVKFMNTLEEGKTFGLRYVESADKDELYVYLDKSLAPLEQLDKLTKNYTLKPKALIDYAQDNPFVHTYVEHSKALDIATSGAYSISTHNSMDYRKFEELTKYLPDSVRDNMLQEDYLVKHDMIANKFAQTMLGDYGSGVGSIFPTNSSNLMTNTSNVMKHVYENLRGKDMYKTLFYNQENSLKTWVETTSRLGQLDYADVRQAINNANMIVAEYVDGRVRRVNINTLAKYNRAIDSGAVLLDYHSYTRSIEVLNDNQISSTLINTLNKPLRWIKVGQLMSPGWIARNIPDSTIKGWVQAGMDPMYMTAMFTRTQKHISEYHRVYAEMFKKYDGVVNAKNITDYFDTVKDASVPKDLFNKMLTFYSNSASSPTSKQLDLYKDMAGALYKRVKGTNGLRESDVRKTLDIFKKFPTYAAAKEQLRVEYPRELADILLNLRKYTPDQEIGSDFFDKILNAKFLPPHWILKGNNEFEAFIRMHTFLYHTEYTNGSVAEAIKMVDLSQFNRSRDTKGMKILEMLFPFSSFQLDNAMFWSEALAGNKHSVAALAEDVISSMHSSTDASSEELSRNMSLDYLYMSGNLILNQDDGMTLKVNDSLHGVLQLLSNPIGSFAEMFNMPIEVAKTLITAINADPEAYKEDSYNNPKPLSEWDPKDWTEEMLQLIPLVGVIYQRYNTAWGRKSYSDAVMPLIFPSIFGVVKTDAAGTTYQSRPVGYDWYSQSQEYKDTHRFVYGVSYVPSWLKSDPKTYADTLTRLIQMGYDREDAVDMMQTGWYMKAPDYLLKQYLEFDNGIKVYRSPSEGITSQQYPDGSWNYRNTVKGTHYGQDASGNWNKPANAQRSYRPRTRAPKKKVKSFAIKYSNPINYSSDRYDYADWKYSRYKKPRRLYRPTLYRNLFTRNGSSRLAMLQYRGSNRSSRQLLRDRSTTSRIKTQRIIHQVRGW